jgi:hypothetical protein
MAAQPDRGDRGHARADDLAEVVAGGADFLGRAAANYLRLVDRTGRPLDRLAMCRQAVDLLDDALRRPQSHSCHSLNPDVIRSGYSEALMTRRGAATSANLA